MDAAFSEQAEQQIAALLEQVYSAAERENGRAVCSARQLTAVVRSVADSEVGRQQLGSLVHEVVRRTHAQQAGAVGEDGSADAGWHAFWEHSGVVLLEEEPVASGAEYVECYESAINNFLLSRGLLAQNAEQEEETKTSKQKRSSAGELEARVAQLTRRFRLQLGCVTRLMDHFTGAVREVLQQEQQRAVSRGEIRIKQIWVTARFRALCVKLVMALREKVVQLQECALEPKKKSPKDSLQRYIEAPLNYNSAIQECFPFQSGGVRRRSSKRSASKKSSARNRRALPRRLAPVVSGAALAVDDPEGRTRSTRKRKAARASTPTISADPSYSDGALQNEAKGGEKSVDDSTEDAASKSRSNERRGRKRERADSTMMDIDADADDVASCWKNKRGFPAWEKQQSEGCLEWVNSVGQSEGMLDLGLDGFLGAAASPLAAPAAGAAPVPLPLNVMVEWNKAWSADLEAMDAELLGGVPCDIFG